MRWMTAALLLCWSWSVLANEAEDSQGPRSIAVIVNPQVTQDSVSEEQLRKILVGEVRFWDDGTAITLLIQAPVSWERDMILGEVMEMTEAQYRQFWISKVFRTEVASGPKVVLSNSMAGTLISKIPGCVAFVESTDVPDGAKVMKINDLGPSDENYPLRF